LHFAPTKFDKAWLIKPERHEDERGFFARTWCQREFEEHGLDADLVQCNVSFNKTKGTLRGMHFQAAPHEEVKVVRCARGRIFDVIVDVRKDSPTFGQWQGFELSEENRYALYVPEDFAHGFLTLESNSEVFYQMSQFYVPAAARGLAWNDEEIAIDWKYSVEVISERDAALPPLSEVATQAASRTQCIATARRLC
jgi:dTDP-4-dehydrorhamnose 3,5-epimerase